MPILNAERLIIAFKKLGAYLASPDAELDELIHSVQHANSWFTPQEVKRSFEGLASMLAERDICTWFEEIEVAEVPKRVGLVLAGNIPMVGFHDIICVLATGNMAIIKLSSSDDKLLPAVLSQLIRIEPMFAERIQFTDRLANFDAVIATGTNNSARYFDYYFSKVPNVIRKNRNSVAVLTGTETPSDIAALGHDIFNFFGLGCRNVSKIYLPEQYDLKNFFEPLEIFSDLINHFKYRNNYDYNKSIYLVNQVPHFDNGFLLLKEDEGLSSPLSVVYFERYKALDDVTQILNSRAEELQCVVSKANVATSAQLVGFGESQQPKLWDFADNVNTVRFLMNIEGATTTNG